MTEPEAEVLRNAGPLLILAIVILPELTDPEMAIFEVAGQLLPTAVTGLVMAAIMAAIMSTADSLLLQTGSIASRDLYQRFINLNHGHLDEIGGASLDGGADSGVDRHYLHPMAIDVSGRRHVLRFHGAIKT